MGAVNDSVTHRREAGLLSVVVPAYNAERYLGVALASVVGQTYRPMELLIVDDGSTDATATVVERFEQTTDVPIIYQRQVNQGPAAARNLAIELSSGEWVAFQDADDIWHARKLERQFEVFAQRTYAGVVWGESILFRGDARPAAESTGNPLGPWPMFLLQSMLLRRSVLDRVGGFNSDLRVGEDVDWIFRAREKGIRFVVHRDLVLYYRRHDNNTTGDANVTRQHFLSMFKRSLDRRRGAVPSGSRVLAPVEVMPGSSSAPNPPGD